MSDKLVAMVRELRAAKDEKAELEAALKVANGTIRDLAEHKIPDYMEDNDIDKLSVDGVGTVFLQQKVYASVKADEREAFYEWLRDNGNGDLVKETVHPSTLNAFAKEQLSEGKALPEMCEARLYPTAMLRRK